MVMKVLVILIWRQELENPLSLDLKGLIHRLVYLQSLHPAVFINMGETISFEILISDIQPPHWRGFCSLSWGCLHQLKFCGGVSS